VADPIGPKGQMRGGIRRQGHDTWQIRVYNSAARWREYFTVTGTLKDARDAPRPDRQRQQAAAAARIEGHDPRALLRVARGWHRVNLFALAVERASRSRRAAKSIGGKPTANAAVAGVAVTSHLDVSQDFGNDRQEQRSA
jgi:hypothetical protein